MMSSALSVRYDTHSTLDSCLMHDAACCQRVFVCLGVCMLDGGGVCRTMSHVS